jgi:CysZ protein
MNFFTGFFKGFGNCFKAFELIFNKGLWPFLLYPLAIWIITFVLALFGMTLLADQLSQWLKDYFSFENIPEQGHWLSFAKPFLTTQGGEILFWIIKIILWFIAGFFSKYILLLVLSPLFALLSEISEEKLTGKKFPFSFTQFLKDILRGVGITLRNLLMESVIIVLCLILSFIFAPVGILTVPFLVLVSWYFTGFTMLDYSAERHKLKAGESTRFVRLNKGYACGIGCVYWLFMLLPFFVGDVIGIMFGPALAVVGATVSFLEINKK